MAPEIYEFLPVALGAVAGLSVGTLATYLLLFARVNYGNR